MGLHVPQSHMPSNSPSVRAQVSRFLIWLLSHNIQAPVEGLGLCLETKLPQRTTTMISDPANKRGLRDPQVTTGLPAPSGTPSHQESVKWVTSTSVHVEGQLDVSHSSTD